MLIELLIINEYVPHFINCLKEIHFSSYNILQIYSDTINIIIIFHNVKTHKGLITYMCRLFCAFHEQSGNLSVNFNPYWPDGIRRFYEALSRVYNLPNELFLRSSFTLFLVEVTSPVMAVIIRLNVTTSMDDSSFKFIKCVTRNGFE